MSNANLMASRLGKVSAVIVVGILASISTAQQPQQREPLRFEVAAVKASDPRQPANYKVSPTQGAIHIVNMPLRQWVEMALPVSDYALKAPAWLEGARFDLDAKFPAGGPFSQKDINEMIRNLLIERFGLKWHDERGIVSGYKLVAGKKLLLKPSDLSNPKQRGGRSRGQALIAGHNMSMSDLATALGEVLEKPVVDATHLSGGYEINLVWRPLDDDLASVMAKRMNMSADDLPPSVFAALQEQLGLRLQNARVLSDVIVLDNVSRQPTDN